MSERALEDQLRNLLDRQAIHDVIVRYCRGVDRMDREMLLSAYHPDAIDDHGLFVGGPEEFADYFMAFHGEQQSATQHVITNHYCEIDGDTAHCETYWLFAAMNRQGPELSLGGGRYIDRMERRDGRWAIAQRKCLYDWQGRPGEYDLPPEQVERMLGAGPATRDRSDPSYERPLRVDPRRISNPPQSGAN
ncbi:MAG: nuclear transport factor 2 family protein [Deltaproteobacteria bacterium]|jgi:ketosteroid isomerase-like protein|nr:nuclear transport factor 2 family protein [Deltaproteobacteria bacterium]MBW2498381.1 nuclear transport factor 2 family protein [Deltaproteobacteria bacterium]